MAAIASAKERKGVERKEMGGKEEEWEAECARL